MGGITAETLSTWVSIAAMAVGVRVSTAVTAMGVEVT